MTSDTELLPTKHRPNQTKFGRFLDLRLHDIGATQVALADRAGVSQASVSDWVNGDKVPRPRSIDALSTALAALEGFEGDRVRIRQLRDRMMRLAGHFEGEEISDTLPVLPEHVTGSVQFPALAAALETLDEQEVDYALRMLSLTVEHIQQQRNRSVRTRPWPALSPEAVR